MALSSKSRRSVFRGIAVWLGILVLIVPIATTTADDLGDERLPLHPSLIAPGIDPEIAPDQVGGLLPEALPPDLSSFYDATTPPPTVLGAYFDRPALAAPRPWSGSEFGVFPPDTVPTPGIVADPPISYLQSPSPSMVEDIGYRDGPRIPEPMVFDLVRGLGARRGELEVNVLNLVPFRGDGRTRYEWAPEIEYALFDGFALEFELPIFNTHIEAAKYAAQYTFGTAFDDAFIHGIQGILQHDFNDNRVSIAVLYLAGLRLDQKWSLFGMFGFNAGQLVFPFDDIAPRRGLDMLVNLSVFYDVTERFLVGVETNIARNFVGSGDILIMPQFHWDIGEHYRVQFGVGVRDTGIETFPELGFRVIRER
ncbi:hypothetical protein [Tautonia rosea]|uniref:hypothetical protein n=1 Tax=Tautonia rosea TaxID=2728037 RepID=UPI001474A019|nr:hypothetical protein [Tautonia rosea]